MHLLKHLLDNVILLNFASARPLRANNFVLDKIRVEAFDHWVRTSTPLLLRTSFSKAKGALKAMDSIEFLSLH